MKATLRYLDGRTSTVEIPKLTDSLYVPAASAPRLGVYDEAVWPTERRFLLRAGTPDAPVYVEVA